VSLNRRARWAFRSWRGPHTARQGDDVTIRTGLWNCLAPAVHVGTVRVMTSHASPLGPLELPPECCASPAQRIAWWRDHPVALLRELGRTGTREVASRSIVVTVDQPDSQGSANW